MLPMRHAAPGHVRDTGHRNGGRPPVSGHSMGARPVRSEPEAKPHQRRELLRGQPVGGQGAADRWTAPGRRMMTLRRGGLAASPLRYTHVVLWDLTPLYAFLLRLAVF